MMQKKYNLNEPIIRATKAVFLTDSHFDQNDWITLGNQFKNIISENEQHLLLGETGRFKIDYFQNQDDSKKKKSCSLLE